MTGQPELPTSVKVGWSNYAIEIWEPRKGIGADRYGETSHTESVIRIDLQYGTRQAAQTLLHEILHAVWAIWKLAEGDGEERLVSAFASGLSTVWRDNPGVQDWINWHITKGTD